MKTKELIKRLHEADPSGEEEVTVGNTDIHFVCAMEAYWDGCQQILIRDEKEKCYNIIGGKVRAEGTKIMIHLHSISDAIFSNPKLPVDYSEVPKHSKSHYKTAHDDMRAYAKKVDTKIRLRNFIDFVKIRVPVAPEELINDTATDFYMRNIEHNTRTLPDFDRKDLKKGFNSIHNREQTYWNNNIFVKYYQDEIIIQWLDHDE